VFIVSAVPFGPAKRLADALRTLGSQAIDLSHRIRDCDPAAVAQDHMAFMDAAREVKRCRNELVAALQKQAVGEALADAALIVDGWVTS
jgi:hypothetical protein